MLGVAWIFDRHCIGISLRSLLGGTNVFYHGFHSYMFRCTSVTILSFALIFSKLSFNSDV
jgi:hypothetical protein